MRDASAPCVEGRTAPRVAAYASPRVVRLGRLAELTLKNGTKSTLKDSNSPFGNNKTR